MKVILNDKEKRKLKKKWVKQLKRYLESLDFEVGDVITITLKVDAKKSWD